MEDERIIELYWAREEAAIAETKRSYGDRLRGLAYNILRSREDAEESENDTYWKTWESIPPQRPRYFFAFLARICRNLSIHRLDWSKAGKRSAEVVRMTEELSACIPDPDAGRRYDEVELGDLISRFLRTQPKESRAIFVQRYVLAEPIGDIARHTGASESKVHSVLFRTRNRLRDYLEGEGVTV